MWLELGGLLMGGLLAVVVYLRLTCPFLQQDLRYYLRLRAVRLRAEARRERGVVSLLDCFLERARSSCPHKAFLITEERSWTYREVDMRSEALAEVFRGECGLREGDTVAVLMRNEADFVCVFVALSKLCCQPALLNVSVKARALLQCTRSCGARALVLGADLVGVAEEVWAELQQGGVQVWVMDHSSPHPEFGTLLDKLHQVPGEKRLAAPNVDITSNFLYIFTSGTTGLPKAARVGHLKAVMSMAFLEMCGAVPDDVIYVVLPLYHMSALLLALGGCISLGATCVLKRKFSARVFWSDCVRYQVTVVQYIGELCRYLMNQPEVEAEHAHSVRLFVGSGLRADVWRGMTQRFRNIRIREGYGLTEASVGFLNYTDEIGPIGRAGFFTKRSMPFELLQLDPQLYEPVRTRCGRCLRVAPGEAGLLVAPLSIMNQFLGYAGHQLQSEKKILRDVFEPGDTYFNTGDLLLQDHRGFLYFRDRLGDTFRWKGENVSTTEVSEVLGRLEYIQEANVYGVTVPGREGRAGMAAVVLKADHKLDGSRLFRQLQEALPSYAWPWFLRLQTSLDVTETFKQQKSKLVQEGFDPAVVPEPLLFLDVSLKTYIDLTPSVYQQVVSGERPF